METFQMSKKELNQVSIFENLKDKKIKQNEGAKILGLSIRQVKRKIKAYRKFGAISLIHKSRGKPSNHRLDDDLVGKALNLVRQKYPDFGPKFAAEKLSEIDKVIINSETLRLQMIKEGLWEPKVKKVNRHHFRERKECFGEMIQADGSDHRWFEDRAPACTLLGFIDDATSRIVNLKFTDGESTANLMRTTKDYFEDYGRPASLYVDRGGVYKVNIHNEEEEKITQYKRALDEIDVKLIWARSPQAKGRVERLFETLQDRLVKELRLRGISDIKSANEFLKTEYIDKHNAQFAVPPKSEANLHRPIKGYNLEQIFCLKEERSINNDMTVRYKNNWFQLEEKQPTLIFPRNKIEIWENLNGEISFHIRECQLNIRKLEAKPIKIKETKEVKPKTAWTPPANHPWRNYQKSDISILVAG
jgi:hypothetical protein